MNDKMTDQKPNTAPEKQDVPCKRLANYTFELAKNLLLDKHANNGGKISASEIIRLFDKLEQAPDDLDNIYLNKFSKCSSLIQQSFVNNVKLSTSFQRDLEEIVGDKVKTLRVGHLQNIGLNNIRKSLGDQWELLSEKILSLAENCIKRRLTQKDSFSRGDDQDFIICFAELSGDEALFKAKAIEAGLIEEVLGADAKAEFDKFNLDVNQLNQLTELKLQTHEIEFDPEELSKGNLYDNLLNKVKEKSKHFSNDINNTLKIIANNGSISSVQLVTRHNKGSSHAMSRWDKSSKSSIIRMGEALTENQEHIQNLDCTRLLASIKYLYEMKKLEGIILTIDVHYSTLKNHKSLANYLKICNELSKEIKKHINFKIHGMNQDERNYELINNCNILLHFCKSLSVQIKTPLYPLDNIYNTNFSAIIIDYLDYMKAMRTLQIQMKTLSAKLKMKNIPLIIDNVPKKVAKTISNMNSIKGYYTANW